MKVLSFLWAIILTPSVSWGYSYFVNTGCRSGHPISFGVHIISLNEISFPTGSVFENSFIQAQNEVNNNVPGSGWRQAHNKYSLPYIAFNDGLSEAAFISFSQAGIPGTGYTSWWYHDKFSWAHFCFYYDYIRKADVVLNADQFVDPPAPP